MSGLEKKPKVSWIVAVSLILILIGTVFFFMSGGESPKPLLLERLGIWVFTILLLGAFSLSMVGYYGLQKSQGSRTGKLCTASCAILSVFIIAGAAILPDHSFAPPEKQWMACKIAAWDIGTAISVYAGEHVSDGELPADNDFGVLRIKAEDLDGRYYNQTKDNMFSYTVHSLKPLKYTVTVTNKYLEPSVMTLDQDGVWVEIEH